MKPVWECEPLFGVLCGGLGVISKDDIALARTSGLRVFVYRSVPKSFHHQLFQSSQPAEVRSGKVCDLCGDRAHHQMHHRRIRPTPYRSNGSPAPSIALTCLFSPSCLHSVSCRASSRTILQRHTYS